MRPNTVATGSSRYGLAFLCSLILGAMLARPAVAAAPTARDVTFTQCAVPKAGQSPRQVDPGAEALDAAALQQAVNTLSLRLRMSVQVFRNNFLVATDPLEPLFAPAHNNMWSVTKSVVSMLTGIALGEGKLRMADRIGKYLPKGWGDARHRRITVRDLLTQTSGLDQAILAEAATTGVDPSLPREALAQPFVAKRGTRFQYFQLGPALLGYVVQRAVHMDLQTYAQRRLFGPIGIAKGSYFWLRDRSGVTYGYSNLFLTPDQFARLALLMSNDGRWRKRQVIPASYVAAAGRPTKTNGCYGLLFWSNGGRPCIGADIPDAQVLHRRMIPSAPRDAYEMNGTGSQLAVMIPSLHMTVVTTGYFGNLYPDPPILLGATADEMQYTFFRQLMAAVQDVDVPDPGPYQGDPIDLDLNPLNYLDPAVLLQDTMPSPDCNILVCDGSVPTQGLIQDVQALPGVL